MLQSNLSSLLLFAIFFILQQNCTMDRHKTQSNRHKTKEVFKCGSEKRKMAKEKEKKNEQVLAKSRRMTEFITKSNLTAPSVSEVAGNNDVINDDVDEPIVSDNTRQPDNQTETNEQEEVMNTPEEVPISLTHSSEFDSVPAPKISVCSNSDIGKWPIVLTSSDIDICVKMDTVLLQNCDEDLFERNSIKQSDTGKGHEKGFVRKCHTNLFIRKTRNGETIKRSWLCFSPSDGHVYCYVCKLFSSIRSQFTHGGYCDWKNAAARLIEHETSKLHLNAVIDFAGRSKTLGKINQELTR